MCGRVVTSRQILFVLLSMLLTLPMQASAITQSKAQLNFYNTLYDVYLGKNISALIDLETKITSRSIAGKKSEINLLHASLMQSAGFEKDSEQKLKQLLTLSDTTEQKSEALRLLVRFYLREPGRASDALDILGRHSRLTEDNRRDEFRYYQVIANLKLARFTPALQLLASWESDQAWRYYAMYNAGISLLGQGRDAEGVNMLQSLLKVSSDQRELIELKDQANVSLAYHFLKNQQYEQAISALQSARLESLVANRAMLGLGWAYAERNDFAAALAPWLALTQQNPNDGSVQEALLAAAYAFSALGADAEALERYRFAATQYEQVLADISQVEQAIQAHQWREGLLNAIPESDYELTQRIAQMDNSWSAYLFRSLLQDDAYREDFRHLRDLQFLQQDIQMRYEKLMFFQGVVDVNTKPNKARPTKAFSRELEQTQRQIDEIKRTQKATALASEDEQQDFKLMAAMWRDIRALPRGREQNNLAQRLRIVRGQYLWRMQTEFSSRLAKLEAQLAQAKKASQSTSQAEFVAVANLGELSTSLYERNIQNLAKEIEGVTQRLRDKALLRLSSQRQQVNTYLAQVRFAAAELIDRTSGATGEQ